MFVRVALGGGGSPDSTLAKDRLGLARAEEHDIVLGGDEVQDS